MVPARNNLALARRMLVPLRSDLEAVCSFMVPVCRHLGLLRSAVPVLRNFYGVDAQIGWRQSLNLYGAAAQVRAVLYLMMPHSEKSSHARPAYRMYLHASRCDI